MRYLLDTHVVLALVNDAAGSLPAEIQSLLLTPDRNFVVSVATIWEIAIKSRLNKLPLSGALETLPIQLASLEMEILDVAAVHVLAELVTLPATKDPFDRLLVAVAQVEQIELVSVDRALRDHPLAWKPASA